MEEGLCGLVNREVVLCFPNTLARNNIFKHQEVFPPSKMLRRQEESKGNVTRTGRNAELLRQQSIMVNVEKELED